MSNWRGRTHLRSRDALGERKGMVGGSGEGRRDDGEAQRREWAGAVGGSDKCDMLASFSI